MIKAADVVRAHELLRGMGPERDELRDLLRRCIAGLSPEEADAALVDLFHEIDCPRRRDMGELRLQKPNARGNRGGKAALRRRAAGLSRAQLDERGHP